MMIYHNMIMTIGPNLKEETSVYKMFHSSGTMGKTKVTDDSNTSIKPHNTFP